MRSLALKLSLAFLFVGLLGAFLVAVFVRRQTLNEFDQFVLNRDRASIASALSEYYQANSGWSGIEEALRPGRMGGGGPAWMNQRFSLAIVDANGTVVLGDSHHAPGAHVPASTRNRGIPIEVDDEVVGWLLVDPAFLPPIPGSPEANFLARVTQAITWSALGATAVALLLGALLARTLTRPIRELIAATRAMAQGNLGQQVRVRTQDELGELAVAFNQMSADLARASEQRRQMTADIAHELRTPLSVLMGYTEALQDGKLEGSQETFRVMHAEALHLNHLIDDLRTLALADAGQLSLTLQRVAPTELLERTAAAYQASAQAQGVTLQVIPAEGLPPLQVDPERMAQVLGNLVTNALRHTPAGGQVTLAARQAGDEVHIVVRDTGSGIAPQDLPHVFERFYRGDKARQGDGQSGLGLAIARSLVEMHGGTIEVASKLGEGSTFTIQLPGVQAHPASS